MRHFCRSIELCDDYLRGYYGLKLVSRNYLCHATEVPNLADHIQTTTRILDVLNTTTKPVKASSDVPGDLPPPSLESVKALNEKATQHLADIVRRGTSANKGWDGYDRAELEAARELLDKTAQQVQR